MPNALNSSETSAFPFPLPITAQSSEDYPSHIGYGIIRPMFVTFIVPVFNDTTCKSSSPSIFRLPSLVSSSPPPSSVMRHADSSRFSRPNYPGLTWSSVTCSSPTLQVSSGSTLVPYLSTRHTTRWATARPRKKSPSHRHAKTTPSSKVGAAARHQPKTPQEQTMAERHAAANSVPKDPPDGVRRKCVPEHLGTWRR